MSEKRAIRGLRSYLFTLEVGCGSSKLGDVNIDLNRNARPDIVCDAEYTPMTDKVFDRVGCFEVIEHVHSPFLVFKEIYRVLKPNGELVVSTPNPYLWIRLFIEVFCKKNCAHPDHIFCFTKGELENLARRAGFYVTSSDYENPPQYKRYWEIKNLRGSLVMNLDKFIPMKVLRKRHIMMFCKKIEIQ